MTIIILKILMVVILIAMLFVNYLSNSLPINKRTASQISDEYPSYFTPPGVTFSIWGIIYLLVIAVVINALFTPSNQFSFQYPNLFVWLFILSSLSNILWLLLFHYDQILLSTFVMVVFLASLIWIAFLIPNLNQLTTITFSIYTGWVSVALIANITILLVKNKVTLFIDHEVTWYIAIMIIGVLIGVMVSYISNNVYYNLVFVWAYANIFNKHLKQTDYHLKKNFNGFNGTLLLILVVSSFFIALT